MHARRENLKVCQHIACKHHHQSCGKRPQWLIEPANGGNRIWKECCKSNLYLRARASIIRQELPNCWVSTLKAMLWVRHVASYSQGYALSETRCLSTLKAMLWLRHIVSLLPSLCSVCDMLLCVQMCFIIFSLNHSPRGRFSWNFGRKRMKLILR